MLCACVVVISLKTFLSKNISLKEHLSQRTSLSKNISLKVFNRCLFFKAFF